MAKKQRFEADYNRLTHEERARFRRAVSAFIAALVRWADVDCGGEPCSRRVMASEK